MAHDNNRVEQGGVRGSVLASESGLPLGGVHINWIASDVASRHLGNVGVVIGEATSKPMAAS